jgi:hypothetical protein
MWVFGLLGFAALLAGLNMGSVNLLILGLWFHLCGGVAVLEAANLERAAHLVGMIHRHSTDAHRQ